MADKLVNPYGYYQRIYEEEILKSDSVKRDEFVQKPINKRVIYNELSAQLKIAKKEKEKFIYNAMKDDPAFMADPIEDYYLRLIPEEFKSRLTNDEIEEIVAYYDPVTWAKKNLYKPYGGWIPRVSKSGFPYQVQLIRTLAKRVAVRAGRRIGKTASLAVRILHRAFTWRKTKKKGHYNIVIFVPNQTQVEVIFKMFEHLLEGNSELLSMLGSGKNVGKIPTRKTPNYVLEISNGVTISAFVSGSTAVRGSAADMLILDEASYLTSDDTDAVTALINEHQDVDLWVSSTPRGPKDYFYERVMDPRFVSFYFPTDKYHPEWSLQMEQDFKSQLTTTGFLTEVLAEFLDEGQTVFQKEFVDKAIKNYSLNKCSRKDGWLYSIGVDWNDPENGTQIITVGYDVKNMKYKVVDAASIHIKGWTQTRAVEKVREMTNKWLPDYIYTDYGYGAGQNERLHEIGLQAPPNSATRRLLNSKNIQFNSTIEVVDPWTKQRIKKQVKSYMVNNAVRVFENEFIEISEELTHLIDQVRGYYIARVTPQGVPVYEGDSKAGDHALDALMLALFAFHMEGSSLTNPKPVDKVYFSAFNSILPSNNQDYDPIYESLMNDKLKEKKEYYESRGIYDWNKQPITQRREGSTSLLPTMSRASLFIQKRKGKTRRSL